MNTVFVYVIESSFDGHPFEFYKLDVCTDQIEAFAQAELWLRSRKFPVPEWEPSPFDSAHYAKSGMERIRVRILKRTVK